MKYKVGDKARIKSLEWYESNKNKEGLVMCNGLSFTESMTDYCGKVLTIQMITNQVIGKNQKYIMVEPELPWGFNDDMIEGIADSDKPKMVSLDDVCNWLEEHMSEFCSECAEQALISWLRKAMEE